MKITSKEGKGKTDSKRRNLPTHIRQARFVFNTPRLQSMNWQREVLIRTNSNNVKEVLQSRNTSQFPRTVTDKVIQDLTLYIKLINSKVTYESIQPETAYIKAKLATSENRIS